MTPIAHSRYVHSCKFAFVLAQSIAKHKPIEQEDYWEKEGELEGVEKHAYTKCLKRLLN